MKETMEETNPYPKDEPDLRDAWNDGFQAGMNGADPPEKYTDGFSEVAPAWFDGYMSAQEAG